MKRGYKVVISLVMVGITSIGYGIYWYHENKDGLTSVDERLSSFFREIKEIVVNSGTSATALAHEKIGQLAIEDRINLLIAMSKDEQPILRTFAVMEMVDFIHDQRVIETLTRISRYDSDPDVRVYAKKTLEKMR